MLVRYMYMYLQASVGFRFPCFWDFWDNPSPCPPPLSQQTQHRETDKQRICVNTQLKKTIYPIKIERKGTHTQMKKSVRKHIFMYGYRIFWNGRRICNCH